VAADASPIDPDAATPGGAGPPPAPLLSLRVLVLLCVVVPLVAYAAVGAMRHQQIRAETEVRLDRALRIAQEHAQKVFDINDAVLERVLDSIGDDDDASLPQRERPLHDRLRAIAGTRAQIDEIRVLAADGRLLATSRAYPARAAAASGTVRPGTVGVPPDDPYVSAPFDGGLFETGRGRLRSDGSVAGSVSIALRREYFERFHGDLVADEPGLAVTMLRADGTILTRWPLLDGAPLTLSPNSPVMSRIRTGQQAGTANGVSSVDGRERLLTYGKVGRYPVFVGTGMDVAEIRARWLREMAWLAAFGLPPLLGLFVAARVAIRRTGAVIDAARRLSEESSARQRVEEALLQSQKLEALGRLTGGVAHDFNNALMVISNNLFLLRRLHPQSVGPQVESIARAVGTATKLTRQLLAFSRRQALVPEHVRLQETLPTLRDLIGPVLGPRVELSVTVAPDTRPIHVDPAEFELALINLAVNARDAMPEGGRFGVHASNAVAPPPPLAVPMVVVEALDTGSGIDPSILHKVFEPFFTTKPVGEGTGLGLSQIYGLCQRAGGLATIDSAPGAGTVVRLYFPATEERPADAAREVPVLLRRLERHVLLVEDNTEVANALGPVLESMGCTVTWKHSGVAARDWLSRRQRLPDLLLSDVVMHGGVDGLSLAQHVRATYPSIAILLMTGYAEQLEAISVQGFDVVPKPCSVEVLANAIAIAGSSHRTPRRDDATRDPTVADAAGEPRAAGASDVTGPGA
jgi:signal transduction histidine kinase/CheY-like chemotaxis protein